MKRRQDRRRTGSLFTKRMEFFDAITLKLPEVAVADVLPSLVGEIQ